MRARETWPQRSAGTSMRSRPVPGRNCEAPAGAGDIAHRCVEFEQAQAVWLRHQGMVGPRSQNECAGLRARPVRRECVNQQAGDFVAPRSAVEKHMTAGVAGGARVVGRLRYDAFELLTGNRGEAIAAAELQVGDTVDGYVPACEVNGARIEISAGGASGEASQQQRQRSRTAAPFEQGIDGLLRHVRTDRWSNSVVSPAPMT